MSPALIWINMVHNCIPFVYWIGMNLLRFSACNYKLYNGECWLRNLCSPATLHVYTGVAIIIVHCIRLLHVYIRVVIIIVHCIRLLHVCITIVHCIRLLRVCITKHLIGNFSCYIRRCMCPEICAIMVSGISTHYGLLGPHYSCIILQYERCCSEYHMVQNFNSGKFDPPYERCCSEYHMVQNFNSGKFDQSGLGKF